MYYTYVIVFANLYFTIGKIYNSLTSTLGTRTRIEIIINCVQCSKAYYNRKYNQVQCQSEIYRFCCMNIAKKNDKKKENKNNI